MMKRTLLQFVVLCVCLTAIATQSCAQEKTPESAWAVVDKSRLTKLSETIKTVMQIHDVPAVSACVIVGNETFFINHGTLSRQSNENVNERSIYQIASLSKTFVGLVTHELVRNGTIKLSDPITKYLPDSIDSKTRQKIQSISIVDLVCHRSGLPRDTLNRNLRRNGTYVNGNYGEADLLLDLREMKLGSVPGERFQYSNYGYSLLAYLLERASGNDYGDLVQELVAKRIGMPDTGFNTSQKQCLRLVVPYDHKHPAVAREPARIGKLGPPTSLYSTTSDLAELMKLQLAEYGEYQRTKEATRLILTHNAKSAWQGTGIKYGFGFFDWGNGTYGHSGGMDGYGSEYTFDPQRNFGFIMLNSSCEAWTQRLTVAVRKAMNNNWQPEVFDELVALESIVADFEKEGPGSALETYQRIRRQDPSPLGKDARLTLINLARQNRLDDAVKLFINDALTDFPKSKRIKEMAERFDHR